MLKMFIKEEFKVKPIFFNQEKETDIIFAKDNLYVDRISI